MEPDSITLYCPHHKDGQWVEVTRKEVVIRLNLRTGQWVFEANCPVCQESIINQRNL